MEASPSLLPQHRKPSRMAKTRRLRNAVVAVLLLLAVAAAVQAGRPAPAIQVTDIPAGARLAVGGKLVAIFRAANGALTPARRAGVAAERLEVLLAQPGERAVTARPRESGWGVYLNGQLIMIATEAEAAEREETPEQVARRWAANLRAAVGANARLARSAALQSAPARQSGGTATARARPAPAARPPGTAESSAADGSIGVPLGTTRQVALPEPGATAVRVDDPRVATAQLAGNRLEVRGEAPGRTVIRVTAGVRETAFTVWVKQAAGRIGEATAAVTGSSVPAGLVRRAAIEAVMAAVQCEPGAAAQVSGAVEGARTLASGETAVVAVPVAITGGSYLPVRSVVRVRVPNLRLPERRASLLLYSNDPESVRQHQVLYQGVVESDGPARLLYHHQNRTGRPFVFQVDLLNPNDEPADVQVIEGEAGPFVDPIQVGHRAAQRYLAAALQDLGIVVRVPARGSRTIVSARVPDNDTVSGLYGLRIVRGPALVARVTAAGAPFVPQVSEGVLEEARAEPHTYRVTQKDERYEYRCGEHWTFIPLGRRAIKSRGEERTLFGNYGVIYNFRVLVENPTTETRWVKVVLSPDAGWTRGVFVIEGNLVEVPQIAPPAEATLYTLRLGAQERKELSIQGIPVGGSNYPVSLVVRP